MSEMTLKPNEKLDVRNILKDLDKYEPKRRGCDCLFSVFLGKSSLSGNGGMFHRPEYLDCLLDI